MYSLQGSCETKIRTHSGGAGPPGGGGVQHRAAVRAHTIREEQHPGAHQLPQQQEAPGQGKGLRPPLQHGPGKRQGNVDGAAAHGKGQEEGEAR